MFVVIVHHWCKPDMVDAARTRIDGNGDAMAASAGFLFRYRLERPEEPLRESTVTAWVEEAAYRAYRTQQAARDTAARRPLPFERVLNEVFEVAKTHAGPVAS